MGEHATGATALVIIDMLNPLAFEGGEALRPAGEAAAERILALRDAADRLKVPVIYVNDNAGEWHSEREKLVAQVLDQSCPGRRMTETIRPRQCDYFVVKPQFSGFYATNLPAVLPRLGVSRLILTGIAADICVLFTAADAHMREYPLWVPADAVASNDPGRTQWALDIMAHSMGADVRPTTERALEDWVADAG